VAHASELNNLRANHCMHLAEVKESASGNANQELRRYENEMKNNNNLAANKEIKWKHEAQELREENRLLQDAKVKLQLNVSELQQVSRSTRRRIILKFSLLTVLIWHVYTTHSEAIIANCVYLARILHRVYQLCKSNWRQTSWTLEMSVRPIGPWTR